MQFSTVIFAATAEARPGFSKPPTAGIPCVLGSPQSLILPVLRLVMALACLFTVTKSVTANLPWQFIEEHLVDRINSIN
jgi:hypothetical protein